MPALFVSHASKDDAWADILERWLRANGFHDFFIDHKSILGGEKWPNALRDSTRTCRVVLCLVSDSWLTSDECFSEFRAAWYMGKRIIPLFVVQGAHGKSASRLNTLRAEDQGIDLVPCLTPLGELDFSRSPETTDRVRASLIAAGALAHVGLDPAVFFVNRQTHPDPFPGLPSFGDDDADAALFYGRSHEIAETLEELRKMRAEGDPRALVIFGASGAGKSSLLKAGIIPRLRREVPAWLPMRAFRPGADPLFNFAEAIARTLADYDVSIAPGTIRDRLRVLWGAVDRDTDGGLSGKGLAAVTQALELEGDALRKAAGRSGASILISIDQAEELTNAKDESSEALADYLRAARESLSNWQIAFTVRTDNFSELQRHPHFQGLTVRGYDLRALPVFRFDSVVEEPAKRYGLEVDQALLYDLMDDAPREDALPLLAFALQRLWYQYSVTGRLTKANYIAVGKLKGLIEDAAERALCGIEPSSDFSRSTMSPSRRTVQICAQTFVPGLAQINEQGATIRRVANWSELNDEAREILQRFDRWRLVVRRGSDDEGGTVEVTHEALFRDWERARDWLIAERDRLETLRSVATAAAAWDRHHRRRNWLDHRQERLGAARALIKNDRYRGLLGDRERRYLWACRSAEHQRRIRNIAAVLAAVIAAGGGVAVFLADSNLVETLSRDAQQRSQRNEDSVGRLQSEGIAAARYALAALRLSVYGFSMFDQRAANRAEQELRRSGLVEPVVLLLRHQRAGPTFASFASDGNSIVSVGMDKKVRVWDARSGKEIETLELSATPKLASFSRDATVIATVTQSDDVEIRDVRTGAVIRLDTDNALAVNDVAFSDDGERVATAMYDGAVQIWDARTGQRRGTLAGRTEQLMSLSFSPDGTEILIASYDSMVRLWAVDDGHLIHTLSDHKNPVFNAVFSPDGSHIVTVSADKTAIIWNSKSGQPIAILRGHDDYVLSAAFSSNGSRVVTGSDDKTARIWDAATGGLLVTLRGHAGLIGTVAFSPDGKYVMTASHATGGGGGNGGNGGGNGGGTGDDDDSPPPDTQDDPIPAVPDNTIRIWDAHTGSQLAILKGHATPLRAAGFNNDGKRIMGVSSDPTVRIWELSELARLSGRSLVEWMCSPERSKFGIQQYVFPNDERNSNSALKGRPVPVCNWQGLKSWAGWRQNFIQWRYKLTGYETNTETEQN
jgi:WD40 repeat protein